MQPASTSGRFAPTKRVPDTQLNEVLMGLWKSLGFLEITEIFFTESNHRLSIPQKGKVREQAKKAQRGRRGIAPLFL